MVSGKNGKSGIVIVEDDTDLLEIMSFFLEEEGYKVRKFKRGSAVYNKVVKTRPQTVIIDLMLPDISGKDLAETIKKNKDLAETKVILISASERVAQSAKESGADAYLSKPFSFDKLLSLI